jgi:hypothetical protein
MMSKAWPMPNSMPRPMSMPIYSPDTPTPAPRPPLGKKSPYLLNPLGAIGLLMPPASRVAAGHTRIPTSHNRSPGPRRGVPGFRNPNDMQWCGVKSGAAYGGDRRTQSSPLAKVVQVNDDQWAGEAEAEVDDVEPTPKEKPVLHPVKDQEDEKSEGDLDDTTSSEEPDDPNDEDFRP